MTSRTRAGYNVGGMDSAPSTSGTVNNNNSGNRKQSIINATNVRTTVDNKGVYSSQQHGGNMTVSSLKNRLAPTIQSALAAAVDTLLGEVVHMLNDSQQELLSKEQENERLKVRLEVSERELKTLQECLCSAQKLIDQLQITYSGNPVSQSVFAPSMSSLTNMSTGMDRDHQHTRNVNGAGGVDLGLGGGSVDESLHGYEPRDDYKMCQLSIQPDGSVTNHSLDSFASNASHMCDSNRPDERSQGSGGGSRFEIKEEQGPTGPTQQPARKQGMRSDGRGPDGGEQSVGDLGYVQQGGAGGEEGGTAGRSFTYPLRHPKPVRPPRAQPPLSDAQKGATRTPGGVVGGGRGTGVSPGRAEDPAAAGGGPLDALPEPTPDRPHHCLECGKTFRLISSLKKHIRIHTGEKPYPCGVCGRRFRESGALKTHLRIHTGEKPYSCSECGNSFRHLDGLRKHRRTHTGEKPYVCAICGKRLSRLQHLKHHQLIHTGERPCCCPFCNRTFKEPAALRKHVRTHREEEGGGHMGGLGGGAEDNDPDAMDDMNNLHPAAPSPHEMRFGEWGAEEDDGGSVVDCV